ncbi:hypothetical protein QTP70_034669, partial [Hemibagrus guttatus]
MLEEWHHWLEGALHPFLVLMDHRNLEYLRSARRLNPRQARWAMFFRRFQFTLTYRPGSKNGKADALSLIHATRTHTAPLGHARPHSVEPHRREPAGAGQRTPSAYLSGQETLRAHLAAPLGAADVADYVESCATCAQSRSSCQLPAGLLEPLPVLQRLWSHMAIDFVTNLPNLGRHNTVLVAIDQFSKACRLVPLKGLPTAMETTTIWFNQVFRVYGLPEDIVSDCGSRVWRAFCMQLGINVNLSSSYHLQSNGQTERLNQERGRYLRSYCSREQQRWSKDSFELHLVDLELEAMEKQIRDLQVKQAQLRQRKATLESSRTDAHLSQAQHTKDAARPGFVHSGAGVPRSLDAAEDASQAPGKDLSPSVLEILTRNLFAPLRLHRIKT